ncbi:---NA--- [Paramuricea clavata]|uniref:---NA n=2 Tax=Paramuricea clavata TaxID=317549 RepID=A0A7D9L673_PARCT|nr:---NA--- [Paramuricea clavata]
MERVNVFKRKRDEMRQRKLAAYQQQQQMSFQMNAMQAMQNPYFRMQFMPPSMQSMMFMQMRAPAVAASQRAQLQAMFNSMPPETRQAFMMNMKSGGSMASMYGQPSMSGMLAGPAGKHHSNFAIPSTRSQQVPHHPHAPSPQHAHHKHASQPSHQTHSTFHPPPGPAASPPVETTPTPPSPPTEGIPAPPPPPAGPAAPPPPPPPPTSVPPPPSPSTPTGSGSSVSVKSTGSADRGGLLQSIQAGTKLRKVGESTSGARKPIPKVESNSMRGALARALDNRAKVLGDEEDDDDDEWDDDDDDDWSD